MTEIHFNSDAWLATRETLTHQLEKLTHLLAKETKLIGLKEFYTAGHWDGAGDVFVCSGAEVRDGEAHLLHRLVLERTVVSVDFVRSFIEQQLDDVRRNIQAEMDRLSRLITG